MATVRFKRGGKLMVETAADFAAITTKYGTKQVVRHIVTT